MRAAAMNARSKLQAMLRRMQPPTSSSSSDDSEQTAAATTRHAAARSSAPQQHHLCSSLSPVGNGRLRLTVTVAVTDAAAASSSGAKSNDRAAKASESGAAAAAVVQPASPLHSQPADSAAVCESSAAEASNEGKESEEHKRVRQPRRKRHKAAARPHSRRATKHESGARLSDSEDDAESQEQLSASHMLAARHALLSALSSGRRYRSIQGMSKQLRQRPQHVRRVLHDLQLMESVKARCVRMRTAGVSRNSKSVRRAVMYTLVAGSSRAHGSRRVRLLPAASIDNNEAKALMQDATIPQRLAGQKRKLQWLHDDSSSSSCCSSDSASDSNCSSSASKRF